jgi:hypothetical protein
MMPRSPGQPHDTSHERREQPAEPASSAATAGGYTGPAHASPYPMSRLAPAYDLVDVAKEIQEADEVLTAVVGDKLSLIADQIRQLQEQARKVLDAAQRDVELHRAECSFKKRPGTVYHLYRRRGGENRLYFSMLSPADWNGQPPDDFEGSYVLGVDSSFTRAEDAEAARSRTQQARALLGPREPRG